MNKKILIMGLPGSGKTTLAKRIVNMFKAKWLNADEIRKKYNDWDFSSKGRIRQAKRLSRLAEQFRKNGKTVVTDFVCPTPELRKIFKADYLIWMDTIKKGRFEDTNKLFVPPQKFDFKVRTKNAALWSKQIYEDINKIFTTNILDCTLRDGGYYNNWDFRKKDIQKYLNEISKTGIKFIELGFRFYDKNEIKGLTAYTKDSLINSLKIPNTLNIGLMINAGDFLDHPIKKLKKIFKEKNDKVKFIRLACHYNEIFSTKNIIKWFKKKKYTVFVNLMQISEIEKKKIIKVCKFLNKTKADCFYFADSLGSLTTNKTKEISRIIKKNYNKEFGIHAHNNLKLALKNSITAKNYGASWIDCTVTGMGRGPGNLKTEDLLLIQKNFSKSYNQISSSLMNFFKDLKKKYHWGPNKFYELAAYNRIHPTYIQRILSDSRYHKKDYINIINNLKKIDARKFNPYKLLNSYIFLSKSPKGGNQIFKLEKNKNILILGPGKNLEKHQKKITKFIGETKPFIISLNTTKLINEKFIDLRVACHPLRIMADMNFHNSVKTKLMIPYSMLSKKIKHSLNNQKKIMDYGLLLNNEKSIKIEKKYCILQSPLAIGYCLSMLISNKVDKSKIFLAGFDGYDESNSSIDETEQMLFQIKKKYLKKKLKSLTPSKYKKSLFTQSK